MVRYEMFWRIRSRELPDSTIHCEGQVVKNYTIHTCLTTQLCKFVLVFCYLVNTCTTRHKSAKPSVQEAIAILWTVSVSQSYVI